MPDITLASFLLGRKLDSKSTPLGPLYLVSSLRRHGYKVDFRDYQFSDTKNLSRVENIVSFLDGSADIIGISTMSNFLPFIILALRKIKKKYPRKTIILGGSGPTGVGEQLLRHFPFIDIVAVGEGENTIIEIMRALASKGDLAEIKGIVIRKNNRVIFTGYRPYQDDWFFSPYDGNINLGAYGQVNVISGRGCSFNCLFCSVPTIFGRQIRFRSIKDTVKELEYIYKNIKDKRNAPVVRLIDDTLIADRRRTLNFCSELKKKKMRHLKWGCYGRVNLMDEGLIKKMSGSGCRRVYYGLESGSDKVLKNIRKGFTSSQAMKMVLLSKKYFPKVTVSFIYGFPFETFQDFQQTLLLYFYFLKQGITVQLHLVSFLPQTSLYERYKDKLSFSRDYISDLIWQGGAKDLSLEVVSLIRKYPKIFTGFYHFDSGLLSKKEAYFKKAFDKHSFNSRR